MSPYQPPSQHAPHRRQHGRHQSDAWRKGGGRATNTWPVDVKVKQKTGKRKNRTGRKVSTLASLVSLGLIGAIIALLG